MNNKVQGTAKYIGPALFGCCLLLFADTWAADWGPEHIPQVSTHAKLWQSKGHSEVAHDSSRLAPIFGDPTSVLEYRDVDSTILELGARANLNSNWFVETNIGAGAINEGTLTDDDFVSAAGSDLFRASIPGAHMISQTRSEISSDDLFYINLLFGRDIFRSADNRTRIGLFGQVQHWEESYVAQGITQTVCTAPNSFCAPAGSAGFQGIDVISNTVKWQSLSLGAEGTVSVGKRMELSGRMSAAPVARLKNDDIHHLRPDLGQSPSFRAEATGYGYGADLSVVYYITPRLAALAGYRYWKMKVKNETNGQLAFPAGSDEGIASDLNSFVTTRQGFLLGLSYAFGRGPSPAAHAKQQ